MEQCIICTQKAEKDDYLVSPQTYKSWLTLLEAPKIRSHDTIIDIAKDQAKKEVPRIYYRRKCRRIVKLLSSGTI